MNIGFSGTRFGMTFSQEKHFRLVLQGTIEWARHVANLHGKKLVAHHGDCVGADAEFHHMVRPLVDWVVTHPPIKNEHRAFCEGDESRDPKPHLVRNQNIVNESQIILACPPTDDEQIRGGTWSTIRLSRDAGKLWRIVLPNGTVVKG